MPVSFPTSKRYYVSFRNSDTGLTPSFVYYKRTDTHANVLPQPLFTELLGGTYYFDVPFTLSSDPDLIFQIDGGFSIPTEEVRYSTGMASSKDLFIDEPISQVKDDVWNDSTNRVGGTKGEYVETIGLPADNSAQATLFGKALLHKESIRGDTAGSSDGNDIEQVYDSVAGAQSDLDDIQGAGFNTATDSLKVISDGVDFLTTGIGAPGAVANAVWDDVVNRAPGTKGDNVENPPVGISGPQVAAAVWDALTASYVVANSFGARIAADATALSDIKGVGFASLTDSLAATSVKLTRALGMLHENSVLDQTTFTAENNLLTGRMRLYDSKANADLATAASPGVYDTGKIAEYSIVATYTGTNLKTYRVDKEFP